MHIVLYTINLATNYRIDPFTNGFIPALLFGLTTAGGIAGYWTARLLKQYGNLPSMRKLLVAVAWAAAMFLSVYLLFLLSGLFMPPLSGPLLPGEPEPVLPGPPLFIRVLARDFVLSSVPGILGGLVLALEIRRGVPMNGWRIAQIIAGWGIGFALGGMLGNGMLNLHNILSPVDTGWVVQDVFIWLSYGITGLLGGAAGAWATVHTIQSVARAPANGAAGFQVSDP